MIESQQLLIRSFKASDWKDLHDYMSKSSVVDYEPYEAFDEETSKKLPNSEVKTMLFCRYFKGKPNTHWPYLFYPL